MTVTVNFACRTGERHARMRVSVARSMLPPLITHHHGLAYKLLAELHRGYQRAAPALQPDSVARRVDALAQLLRSTSRRRRVFRECRTGSNVARRQPSANVAAARRRRGRPQKRSAHPRSAHADDLGAAADTTAHDRSRTAPPRHPTEPGSRRRRARRRFRAQGADARDQQRLVAEDLA